MRIRIHLSFLLLFLLLLGASCKHRPYPAELRLADSLMSHRPDSALIQLKEMEPAMGDAPDAVRMYHRLLCIKAADKAYKSHTSDSTVLSVVHYYEKKGNRRHLPEAYYYAGRVYRDLGDAPQALEYFQKSLEVMEKGDDNLELKSRVHAQIGTLFLYQRMYEEALNSFKQGLKCDITTNSSSGIIFGLRDIADAYRNLNQIDSAFYYYKEALQWADSLSNARMIRSVQSQLASLYLLQGNLVKAEEYIRPCLNDAEKLNKSSLYSIAAKLFHRTNRIDSALHYDKMLTQKGSIYAKSSAHRRLMETALQREEMPKAIHHLRTYLFYKDSIDEITNVETIREMNSIYNYRYREQEALRLKQKQEQQQYILLIVCFAAISIISLLLAYIQYTRKKRIRLLLTNERLEQIQEQERQRSIQFIEESKRKIAELEASLQQADNDNFTLREELRTQKELTQAQIKTVELTMDHRQQVYAHLCETEIYRLFKEASTKNASHSQLTENDWEQLRQTVDTIYKDFSLNVRKLLRYSNDELRVCLLIKLQFKPSEMARLIHRSPEAISAMRRRMYEKAFNRKGESQKWDKIIHSL